jgi:hypothetical protein
VKCWQFTESFNIDGLSWEELCSRKSFSHFTLEGSITAYENMSLLPSRLLLLLAALRLTRESVVYGFRSDIYTTSMFRLCAHRSALFCMTPGVNISVSTEFTQDGDVNAVINHGPFPSSYVPNFAWQRSRLQVYTPISNSYRGCSVRRLLGSQFYARQFPVKRLATCREKWCRTGGTASIHSFRLSLTINKKK